MFYFMGECYICGKLSGLTKHHVKPWNKLNASKKHRTGQVRWICLTCHRQLHGLTAKKENRIHEFYLNQKRKDGRTVKEFLILRGIRMLEAEE